LCVIHVVVDPSAVGQHDERALRRAGHPVVNGASVALTDRV